MIRVLVGDVRERLKDIADESVHCVVTSPPYFGLRDYGTASWEGGDPGCDHANGRQGATRRDVSAERLAERAALYGTGAGAGSDVPPQQYRDKCGKCGATRTDKQIGLEPTPAAFVEVMVEVFREVRRVMRPDATLWLNLGDSYAATTKGARGKGKQHTNAGSVMADRSWAIPTGLKPKDLIGIPWRVAFALQADGWYLRQDIIWHKPNPMPESVTDRCTKAHEYLFLLTKSARYYFDAEAIAEDAINAGRVVEYDGTQKNCETADDPRFATRITSNRTVGDKRNRRSVWTIATQPYSEAHFATFPPDLVEPCILAGTSEKGCCSKCGAPQAREFKARQQTGSYHDHSQDLSAGMSQPQPNSLRGAEFYKNHVARETIGWAPSCKCDAPSVPCTVLDPFGGAGTTALVADRLGRDAAVIELNPEYAALIERRIRGDAGMFASFAAE